MARRARPKQKSQPAEEKKPPVYDDGRPDETAHVIERYKERTKSPITAIRSFCVGCMGGYVKEVKHCTKLDCDLYPLRLGVNVFSAKYGVPRPMKGDK
jgi:hypothetical protein